MAWTEKLPSGKYRAGYRIPTGEKRYLDGTYTHKAQALREANAAEEETRKLGWRDPKAAAKTWAEWCEEWQTTRILAPTTAKDEKLTIKNHLLPRWGNVALIDITRHDVKAWAAKLHEEGRAIATVKKITIAFSTSLQAAVDAEIIIANPATRLKLGAEDNTIERYLTKQEQQALIDAHEHELCKTLTTVLIDSGLRWGEATALTPADIDYDRRMIRVAKSWSLDELRPFTKNGKRRNVPLTERAAQALMNIMPATPNALIFTYDGVHRMDIDSWRQKHHDKAITAAGIDHVRIHDLRHTYASTLLQAGINIAEVSRLLGHASMQVTERYAHLAAVPSDAVLAALGDTKPESSRGANVGQTAVVHDGTILQEPLAEVIPFPTKSQIRA